MTNRFTRKAQNALNHALIAARSFGHSYVGSEHLLVGLASDSESVSARILAAKGATRAKIIDTITTAIGTGTPTDVTAADLTHGHLTGIVATARFLFARQKAFLGLVSHRNGIVTVEDLVTLPGSGRF